MKAKKIIVIFGLMILVISTTLFIVNAGPTTNSVKKSEVDLFTTAAILDRDYTRNIVAAEMEHKNSILILNGTVGEIYSDYFSMPGLGVNGIHCHFGETERSNVASLYPDSVVIVKGVVSGTHGNKIYDFIKSATDFLPELLSDNKAVDINPCIVNPSSVLVGESFGERVLFWAIQLESKELVKLLLQSGVNVQARFSEEDEDDIELGWENYTPLHAAAYGVGNYNITKILLEAEAEVYATMIDENGDRIIASDLVSDQIERFERFSSYIFDEDYDSARKILNLLREYEE